MRYIVDTETEELIEQFVEGRSDVLLVDRFDPIEKLTARVERMKQAFDEFKKNRGNWTILNYYLRGRGINQSEIDTVLKGVEEFLKLV